MGANEYKRVWHNETAKIQQLHDENDKLRSELNTADNDFKSICQSWRDEQIKNKQLQADKDELEKFIKEKELTHLLQEWKFANRIW